MERSRQLAQLTTAGSADKRIEDLYRIVLTRAPDAGERASCLEFLRIEKEADRRGARLHRWSYGYGPFDESTGRVTRFTELPHFTGEVWQGGEKLPDERLGYVSWRTRGGHPGLNDAAAVRRLYIPRNSTIQFRGKLEHEADGGDGVRLTIHCHENGTLGTWVSQHSVTKFATQPVHVAADGFVDLIVDMRDSNGFDSFQLQFQVVEKIQNREGVFDSVTTFRGPSPQLLNPWEKLSQVLLLSNEFLFVE
jgi:hypothetical protein